APWTSWRASSAERRTADVAGLSEAKSGKDIETSSPLPDFASLNPGYGKGAAHAAAPDRVARRMDRRPQDISRGGESLHPCPRCTGPQAPRAAMGARRQALRVRRAERQGNSGRSVRRQEPAYRLSLYAWARLGGRLPELLVSRRPFRWRRRASRPARRVIRRGVACA